MIIAVTGSSGSIGRELIPFLESLGHNVLKVSSSIVSDGELNFSFDQLKNKSISKYVDILIHLASLNSNLDEKKINQEIQLTDDVLSGLSSLQCKKLIFFSTAKVYGDNAFEDVIYSESSSLDPVCSYGKAKLGCEQLIKSKSPSLELDSLILRLPPVLNQSTDTNIAKLINLANRDLIFPTFIEGDTNKRSFISFNNLETIMSYILNNTDVIERNEIYNVADEGFISLNELLGNTRRKKPLLVLPRIVSYTFFKIPFIRNLLLKLYGNFVLDNSKLKRELGVTLTSTSKALSIIYK